MTTLEGKERHKKEMILKGFLNAIQAGNSVAILNIQLKHPEYRWEFNSILLDKIQNMK